MNHHYKPLKTFKNHVNPPCFVAKKTAAAAQPGVISVCERCCQWQAAMAVFAGLQKTQLLPNLISFNSSTARHQRCSLCWVSISLSIPQKWYVCVYITQKCLKLEYVFGSFFWCSITTTEIVKAKYCMPPANISAFCWPKNCFETLSTYWSFVGNGGMIHTNYWESSHSPIPYSSICLGRIERSTQAPSALVARIHSLPRLWHLSAAWRNSVCVQMWSATTASSAETWGNWMPGARLARSWMTWRLVETCQP